MGQEARIVQIDFSAAFDRVNHQGILYKLCSVGVGGSVLSVLTQFLSNRSQYVVVDGCRSKLVNVVNLCLMVWDWRVSRAEPMLSCWHDLLFLFRLLLFYLFLPSIGWLCGIGVFGLIECPHSPGLAQRTPK